MTSTCLCIKFVVTTIGWKLIQRLGTKYLTIIEVHNAFHRCTERGKHIIYFGNAGPKLFPSYRNKRRPYLRGSRWRVQGLGGRYFSPSVC